MPAPRKARHGDDEMVFPAKAFSPKSAKDAPQVKSMLAQHKMMTQNYKKQHFHAKVQPRNFD